MDQKSEHSRSNATISNRLSIPQLDTIRALAMLSIFLHHLWKTVIVIPQGTFQKLLDPLFSSASDGVIVFNIISGFLLAMPHLGPQRRPLLGYREFLRKRFLRIIPPYYIALFIFTLVNILHFSYPLDASVDMLLQHLLFVNSLNYSNMLTNFSPFWYMGLLAQFYLLFPLVQAFFVRFGPGKAVLSISAVCWGCWVLLAWLFPETHKSYPDFSENLMHFNLPGRLPEFALGMWLASVWDQRASSSGHCLFNRPLSPLIAGMSIYLLAGTPFLSFMNLPFIHVYHVALASIFFLVLFFWIFTAKAGESSIVKEISEHSYSLYIVHHPLFSYAGVMPATVAHTIGNFGFLTLWLLPLCYVSARILDQLSAIIVNCFSVRVVAPEPGDSPPALAIQEAQPHSKGVLGAHPETRIAAGKGFDSSRKS